MVDKPVWRSYMEVVVGAEYIASTSPGLSRQSLRMNCCHCPATDLE